MSTTPVAPRNLKDARVLVMGLGRFGGGVGVSRWLAEQGARVTVTDLASREDLDASLKALEGLPITFRLGGHDVANLDGCDLLVVNPAVDKAKSEFFAEARRRGVPWSSEMNLFLERCPATLVGITGSVGKSTTTAMLGTILDGVLEQAGEKMPADERRLAGTWPPRRVWVGGNIGKSLLSLLTEMDPRDVVVLELSSFQLEDAAAVGVSPHIAVVTNFRPNHLDRHGTMEAYAAAKRNILACQRAGDTAILPSLAALSGYSFDPRPEVRAVRFDIDDDGAVLWSIEGTQVKTARLSLAVPGRHNALNAAAALAAAEALGAPLDAAIAAAGNYRGLPHRLEFVREFAGVRYYNDSKATTPEAAITALRAFEQPAVILCGGYDKGLSFDELGRELAARARAVICYGDTRDQIFMAVRRARGERDQPSLKTVHDFRGGVNLARRLSRPGDVVVLSPACASYDMFKNYEQRGDMFRRIVNDWI